MPEPPYRLEEIPEALRGELCAGCGKCCQVMILDGIPLDRRTRMDRSFLEWIALHGARAEVVEGAGGVSVTATVPTPCSKLECTRGAYRCGIYEERPYMCREYSCLDDEGIGETAWKRYIREQRERGRRRARSGGGGPRRNAPPLLKIRR